MLVLRTRQERTERRLRHKKEANPPPMEPPPQLLNNNHLYLDLNMNFSGIVKQQAARMKKVGPVLFASVSLYSEISCRLLHFRGADASALSWTTSDFVSLTTDVLAGEL